MLSSLVLPFPCNAHFASWACSGRDCRAHARADPRMLPVLPPSSSQGSRMAVSIPGGQVELAWTCHRYEVDLTLCAHAQRASTEPAVPRRCMPCLLEKARGFGRAEAKFLWETRRRTLCVVIGSKVHARRQARCKCKTPCTDE